MIETVFGVIEGTLGFVITAGLIYGAWRLMF